MLLIEINAVVSKKQPVMVNGSLDQHDSFTKHYFCSYEWFVNIGEHTLSITLLNV